MSESGAYARLRRLLADRGPELVRTAVLLAGRQQDGEDLLQAALERLVRQRRPVDGSPEAYLRRTLYNLAADGWRRALPGSASCLWCWPASQRRRRTLPRRSICAMP